MEELDFSEMLVKLSDVITKKDVDMLRVLYRDLGVANIQLEEAKSAFDLFELFRGPGILNRRNFYILFETIELTGLNNLKEIIEKYERYPAEVKITHRFSQYRQNVVDLGKRLSVEDIRKICHIHECNFSSPWKLIQHLESTNVLTEETIPSFLEKLKPDVGNEDFNKLLSDMSDAIENKGKQDVDMLRILYTDIVIVQTDLWETKSAFDIFKLLQKAGHLKPTDISILHETIELTELRYLQEIIERYEPYPAEVKITTRFPQYRQNVVDLGNKLTGKYLQRVYRQYKAPVRCRFNGWKLLKYLQDKGIVSEDKISSFPKNVKSDEFEDVPPVKKRRNQDIIIREYLESLQRKLYKDINKITPAFWNDSSIPIDIANVFTDLKLRKLEDKQGAKYRSTCKEEEGRPTSLSEVLGIIKSTESCKVFITGEGGMGKTTLLSYIAHNWANGVDSTFAGKLLFLINVRDIQTGKTILDAIIQKIKQETFSFKTSLPGDPVKLLKGFITEHDNEIVLLLDGLDELEQGAENPIRLFKRLELEECSVILTSRPGNTAKFDQWCDVHVEVKGFSPKSIKDYINKYFKSSNKTEFGNQLTNKFKLDSVCYHNWGGDHKEAFELCSSPFLLLKICNIWELKQHLPTDLSDLFKNLICCILNQYMNRSGNNTPVDQFERIPEKYKCAILALGKYMYEGLKRNKLSIDKFELIEMVNNDNDLIDFALKLGFVYKDKPVAKDDLKKIYTPPHKLMSEAIAGFYLSVEIDRFDSDECESIRSNQYLHMTRVFAIEFLGVNAGKFLKPWLINRASHYYSLAQYFRYVKKEHEEDVLRELDKDIPPEMKGQCYQMCETFRKVLCIDDDDRKASTDKHVLQLMSQCCIKYERKPDNLVKDMISIIKDSTELSTEAVCKRLVHILIIVDGLYGGYVSIHKSYFEYLACFKDEEIDVLTDEMVKLQFTYSSNKFSFSKMKASQPIKLSPKFIIHLMKTTCDLTFITLNCMTGGVLNKVFPVLRKSTGKEFFKLEYICLRSNDLSNFDGVSLIHLLQIAPRLKELDMSHCKLSGKIFDTVINECKSHQLTLSLLTIIICNNHFRDTDGASFANFIKFAPELKYLDISSCGLSTVFLTNLWNECDRIEVVLNDHMLSLTGNNFSDIDGASLAKLVRLSGHSFKWTDYCLSSGNLESLVSYACDIDSRLTLPWKWLDISEINLASTSAETLACAFDISPNLYSLNMNNCNLSGSNLKNLLIECEKIGVVLEDNILSLKGNNFSDIDHKSLSLLINLICVYDNTREGRRQRIYRSAVEHDTFFEWSDYSFTSNNLQGLINECSLDDALTWTRLDLSGSNLDSLTGEALVRLLKLSPQLKYLRMNKCNITGSRMKDFLEECDKNEIKLKDKVKFSLKGNDLSDIDDESLIKVVGLSGKSFKWSDYCLSADNLRDLITIGLCLDDKLTWENLNLGAINLVSMKATQLFGLFKISNKLQVLNMGQCHLQSNVFHDVIKKCKTNNVVLRLTDLVLSENDFHSLNGETVADFPRCIPDLEKLDLSNCSLPCSIMKNLPNLSSDKNKMKSLKSLNLSGNNFSALNETMMTTFSNFIPKLEHLQLINCNLPGSTVQHLSKMSSKLNVPVTLTSIYLGGNDLSGLNWSSFASHISKTHLKVLKLDDCHLPNSFLHDVEKVFSRRKVFLKLNDVFLSNNDLSNISAPSFIQLLTAVPGLMRLYLDNCNLKSKDVLSLVKAFSNVGSRQLLRVFNTLRLSNNDFSDIDGALLASLFSSIYSLCSPSLTSFIPQLVILSSCQLNDSIVTDMIDSWQVQTKSFHLMINDNNIVDKAGIKRKLLPIIAKLEDL